MSLMGHYGSITLDLTRPGKSVLGDVAVATGLRMCDILGKSQEPRFVQARKIAVVELRKLGYSYPRIGRILGGRHHTTVMRLARHWKRGVVVAPKYEATQVPCPDLSGEWAI